MCEFTIGKTINMQGVKDNVQLMRYVSEERRVEETKKIFFHIFLKLGENRGDKDFVLEAIEVIRLALCLLVMKYIRMTECLILV